MLIKRFRAFMIMTLYVFIAACQHTDLPWNKKEPHVFNGAATQIMDPDTRTASNKKNKYPTDARIAANKNVLVYSLDEPLSEQPARFPEYRGVLDNSVAGYTVFDQSVTVYGFDSNNGQKPEYLPTYSVPRYAQPLPSQSVTQRQNAMIHSQPLMPMPGAPIAPAPAVIANTDTGVSALTSRAAARSARPWLNNNTSSSVHSSSVTRVVTPAPVMRQRTPSAPLETSQTPRRPRLTGY